MAQIDKPSLHFNTKLYTGNGSSTQAITGVGFQPDWTWIKNRTDSHWHNLTDAVRGVAKTLRSNRTAAQASNSGSGYVSAFGTDGFTVSAGSSDAEEVNTNNDNYASWNWKANGAGSANTSGSINSTVSVNTTAGFSIVKYTATGSNATVGHGLSVAPSTIIIKDYEDSGGSSWIVYHKSLGATKYLILNDTAIQATGSTMFQDTAPTNQLFSIGTSANVNNTGNDTIAYCFSEKKGFSKFGSYEGNANANGPFIYTGFRPAFVLIKGAISGDGNAAQSWELYDNKRIGHNPNNYTLFPNTNSADSDNDRLDILSNGFRPKINSDGLNDNASTYVYWAFAENPIVGSNNIPAVAR